MGEGREGKKEMKGNACYKSRFSFAFRLLFQFPSCQFFTNQNWERAFPHDWLQAGVSPEAWEIFATECRRLKQKFVKGDGNPMQTLKKNRNFRFCGVNFISVEGRVSFENFFAVGQSWKCEADFGSLLRLCWVAIINQIKKRKLVKTGLQNQKRIWTVQFHWEITLRGWERSKQKTASHHYHARRKRCKKETSRIWRWTAERKKSWKG